MKTGKKQEMEMNQAEVQKQEEAVTENGQKGKNQKKRNRKEKKRTGKKRKKAPFVAAGILVAVIVFRLVAGGGAVPEQLWKPLRLSEGIYRKVSVPAAACSVKRKRLFLPRSAEHWERFMWQRGMW